MKVEKSVHEDMVGEYIDFFDESYGTVQKHLIYNYRYKNTSIKYKYPVTCSSKLNSSKFLDVVIVE